MIILGIDIAASTDIGSPILNNNSSSSHSRIRLPLKFKVDRVIRNKSSDNKVGGN